MPEIPSDFMNGAQTVIEDYIDEQAPGMLYAFIAFDPSQGAYSLNARSCCADHLLSALEGIYHRTRERMLITHEVVGHA